MRHGLGVGVGIGVGVASASASASVSASASALGGAPVVTETVMDGASSEAVMGKGNREHYGFRVENM